MNNRYLGALILAPFIIFIIIGGDFLKYGLLIISLIGLHEFYSVISKRSIKPLKLAGYIAAIVYFIMLKKLDFEQTALVLFFITMILLCVPAINPKYNYLDVFSTLGGFIYVCIFFSFIYLTDQKTYGQYLIWLIFISSWLCDTSAYYAGRYLGRHKLVPKVSPKKTIEGSIGGIIGASLGCIIFGYIANRNGLNIPLYHYLLIGVIASIFSQFGDLAASSIKRYSGVKDYSNLIPGHGGILDRFDSILFSSVIVFYYTTFILAM